jgi:hypothetical protein
LVVDEGGILQGVCVRKNPPGAPGSNGVAKGGTMPGAKLPDSEPKKADLGR